MMSNRVTRGLLSLAIGSAALAQTIPGDRLISSPAPIGSLSFSADGKWIAATCQDRKIRFWDARTGELKQTLSPAGSEDAVAANLADRADLLASTDRNGGIKIWDPNTGNTIRQVTAPTQAARNVVFSSDRKLIAAASHTRADGSEYTVRTWDDSGAQLLALPAGLGGVSAMAFSPDGRTLVAAGYDTNLRAWSTRNGELLRLMEELPLSTFAMAFSPDGKYLATGGADRIVYLWDTTTWKIARKLSGQPEMISAMAISPDSRLLLTGGFSEFAERNPVKALLWDLASGKPVRSIPIEHMVRRVAFSPEGTRAATTSDQTIGIWTIPPARVHTQ